MEKKLKTKWVKALRSGKFLQAQGRLRDIEHDDKPHHCCLGVLCEVLKKEGLNINVTQEGYSYNRKRTMTEALDDTLMKKVGLTSQQQADLVHLNDNKEWCFEDIADYIESGNLEDTDKEV